LAAPGLRAAASGPGLDDNARSVHYAG